MYTSGHFPILMTVNAKHNASNHEPQWSMNYRKDGTPMMNNIYNLEQRMHEEVTQRAAGAKRRDLSRWLVVRTAPVVATRIVLRFGRLVITWA
jgi:hypothetical protein